MSEEEEVLNAFAQRLAASEARSCVTDLEREPVLTGTEVGDYAERFSGADVLSWAKVTGDTLGQLPDTLLRVYDASGYAWRQRPLIYRTDDGWACRARIRLFDSLAWTVRCSQVRPIALF